LIILFYFYLQLGPNFADYKVHFADSQFIADVGVLSTQGACRPTSVHLVSSSRLAFSGSLVHPSDAIFFPPSTDYENPFGGPGPL